MAEHDSSSTNAEKDESPEISRRANEIALLADSLQSIFMDMLEHLPPEGDHLWSGGQLMASKIGYLADGLLEQFKKPQLKGGAEFWFKG
jgi:hypothetical protein